MRTDSSCLHSNCRESHRCPHSLPADGVTGPEQQNKEAGQADSQPGNTADTPDPGGVDTPDHGGVDTLDPGRIRTISRERISASKGNKPLRRFHGSFGTQPWKVLVEEVASESALDHGGVDNRDP